MEKFFVDIITLYGPLGLGWGVAGILYYGHARERREWLNLLSSQVTAFNDNTNAINILVTYLRAKMD